jgi:hypothetical protein
VHIHILACIVPTTLTNPFSLMDLTTHRAKLLLNHIKSAPKNVPRNVKSINNCSDSDNFHFWYVLFQFLYILLLQEYCFDVCFFSFFSSPLLFSFRSSCSLCNRRLSFFSSSVFSLLHT